MVQIIAIPVTISTIFSTDSGAIFGWVAIPLALCDLRFGYLKEGVSERGGDKAFMLARKGFLLFHRKDSSGVVEWVGVWNCIFSSSHISRLGA